MIYRGCMAYGTSASDRLAAVRAAIDKCLYSQEYYVGSRRQRMAELKSLRELEKDLQAELNSESTGEAMTSLGVYGGVE